MGGTSKMNFKGSIFCILLFVALLFPKIALSETYYVSTTGNNLPGNGTEANPWATIGYAVGRISLDGDHTIIVKDGVYSGRTYINRSFNDWVTIKAENPYKAKLTNVAGESQALSVYSVGEANIIIEGFYISNYVVGGTCSQRQEFLIHFQDVSNVILRNNILYGNNAPETCNDVLKLNRGNPVYPRNIFITGNLFYDHVSLEGADQIDSVRPGELDISDNIFFSENSPNAQSFITLKREVPGTKPADYPEYPQDARNPRIKVYRNVFLSWNGKNDQAFIQFGEDPGDSDDYGPDPENHPHQITNSLIENNLLIGNSQDSIAGAMQFKGVKGITVRANTVVGDLPGGSYGFRVGTEALNPTVADIFIRNNIYSDPTGTLGHRGGPSRFMMTYGRVNTPSILLNRNLFYNNGEALPGPTIDDPVAPDRDSTKIIGNPLIEENQNNIVVPRWNENEGQFPSGNTTIRDEFLRLVQTYGAIAQGSPAIDSADPINMPGDDILGMARDANPDIGAFEFGASEPYTPPPDNNDDTTPSSNLDENTINISGGCSVVSDSRSSFTLIFYFILIVLLAVLTKKKLLVTDH